MRARLIASLFVALVACGDDTSPSADAGSDAGLDADAGAGLEIAPPAPPAPPVLTPCPAGWSEEARAGVTVCTPYPDGAPQACDTGFVHLPGDTACTRLGTDCPASGVPEGLPAGSTVVHVRAGAGAGGDGSEASPFGTIGEAVDAAPDGALVAIAPGAYDEALRMVRPVTLWGACPAGVVLSSSAAAPAIDAGVINVESAGVTLRNLTVGASERPGIWATVPAARVELLDVIVEEATVIGVAVEDGAELVATGLVVRDTRPAATGYFGRGLGVEAGGRAHVRRALFERNSEFNVIALHEGTSMTIEDAVIRDGLARAINGRDGVGALALRGAGVRLARVWLAGNTGAAVSALDAGSSVELEDAWLLDSLPQPADQHYGRGLNVELGASALARRVVVSRTREAATFAQDSGTTLRIEDSVIERTLPSEADGEGGRGLSVQLEATAELARVVIADSVENGIAVTTGGATLHGEDVVIRATGAGLDGLGRGLAVEAVASAVVRRVLIESSIGAGALAQTAGTTLELEDARIRRTAPLLTIPARAVGVQRGAVVTGTRIALEDNAQFGAIVLGEGSRLGVTDLLVTETHEEECATCVRGGTALGAFGGGAIAATRFTIRTADLCGVHVGAASEVDLATGEITDCLLGACVQVEGYDLDRLGNDVRYRDNGTNLDTSTLPVPEPLPELPPG